MIAIPLILRSLKRRQEPAALWSQLWNGIPGDLLYPSNRGLVQALDAEGGDLIEGRATMLESMVWRTGVRAECLSATPAPVWTTLP